LRFQTFFINVTSSTIVADVGDEALHIINHLHRCK
jgi:hypothetical protein